MSADAVWFNSGALTVETDSGTAIAIAGVTDITIVPAYEIEELYTADSTLREYAKQYEHNVSVELTVQKWDVTAAQEWLGGEGASATASQDTADPEKFTVEVVTPSADGGTTFERTAAVGEVVFSDWPMVDGSYGEYESYDLSGSGKELTNLADTSGA